MYSRNNYVAPVKEFEERTIQVNRISKKTKGGNRVRFATLIAAGDRKGRVGIGLAKAADVASAIQKASRYATSHMVTVAMKGMMLPKLANADSANSL